MHRIQEAFQRSPRKSTRRASQELTIPHVTVWRVLRRRLLMKPYRLQLVQALSLGDRRKRTDFCDAFLPRLIFSDEATFHLRGKVSRLNVRIRGLENPHEIVQHERDSPKINVLARFLLEIFMALSFFKETLLREIPILKCCRIGYSHN